MRRRLELSAENKKRRLTPSSARSGVAGVRAVSPVTTRTMEMQLRRSRIALGSVSASEDAMSSS